jgi:gluconokinase
VVWIVAGPAGSGKTTLGRALADAVDAELVDADDLHSPANIARMRSGRPLDEDDRRAWLAAARALIDERCAAGQRTVLAMSLLRRAHRLALGTDRPGIRLVWLEVPAGELRRRLEDRQDHFFKAELLDSQLDAMEVPGPDEPADIVDGDLLPGDLVRAIVGDLPLGT